MSPLIVMITFLLIASNDDRIVDPNVSSLIHKISEREHVPAGILYGIWKNESGGISYGWGTGRGWLLAANLVHGGLCSQRYGEGRCLERWNILVALCNMRKNNGSQMCDPSQVRTSYAMAVGPMQILPTTILTVDRAGHGHWTEDAVDYNRDGVIDPLDLPDAMAMAARHLRRNYNSRMRDHSGDPSIVWQWAIGSYFGEQNAQYIRTVVFYWKQWCGMTGSCR